MTVAAQIVRRTESVVKSKRRGVSYRKRFVPIWEAFGQVERQRPLAPGGMSWAAGLSEDRHVARAARSSPPRERARTLIDGGRGCMHARRGSSLPEDARSTCSARSAYGLGERTALLHIGARAPAGHPAHTCAQGAVTGHRDAWRPDRGRRNWRRKPGARAAVSRNRRCSRGARGLRLPRLRRERPGARRRTSPGQRRDAWRPRAGTPA